MENVLVEGAVAERHEIDRLRRRLVATAVASAAAAPFLPPGLARAAAPRGRVTALGAPSDRARSGVDAAPPPRAFAPMQRMTAGLLNVVYADLGPRDGPAVLLLHGWPYDIHTYGEVAPRLAQAGYRVIVPELRGFGATRFGAADTPRNGQQAAFAADALDLLDALGVKQVIVGGCDWGARTACILAALSPERCRALVSVSGYLIGSPALNASPLPPPAEQKWWYQYYFATERGRLGYGANTRAFARLIWETASPRWSFSDEIFERSAVAFDNPDHVAIVVHNYRWRLGLAAGEGRYDEMERRLSALPAIGVPTITLEGDANGAPHPDPKSYAGKFHGPYAHRLVRGGVGHNLPQEAPAAFAQAILDIDGTAQARRRKTP
ncbi:alpha/beta hydrolase [Phenylobacterium sp.]|uniref:alpha/beta fold hydrolase n=1 Tax=Phenylobacterium sp. TaxID=1871053 RepID=UPI00286D07BE|nr:alpha/beta hydrolase [Phenylobacterium sp.]